MAYKITVAISNNKGGVGKTTLSTMLAETFLTKTDKSLNAIDLDPQKNFTDTLSLIDAEKYGGRLTVSNKISIGGDLNIIDCPPALSPETNMAIKHADVVLIPIMADMYSLVNIENIFKLGRANGKTKKQMPLVSMGFNTVSAGILEEIKNFVEKNHYDIVANIPFNKLIPFNILTGQMWEYGLIMNHRRVIYRLLDSILEGEYK
jgi:chromosome partitioning protein